MTLRHRIGRLEHATRPPAQAMPMIIFSCSCGWTDRPMPPDFNGLLIRLNTSGGCPHRQDIPKQDNPDAQTPDEVSGENA